METLVGWYIASIGGLIWENGLLCCTGPMTINARTNDRHATAVYHIGEAVCEFSPHTWVRAYIRQIPIAHVITTTLHGTPTHVSKLTKS